jgi:hypothetical protein
MSMVGYIGRVTVYHTVQAFNEATNRRESWRQGGDCGEPWLPVRLAFVVEQDWARAASFRIALNRRPLAQDPKSRFDVRHGESVNMMGGDRNGLYFGHVQNMTAPFWVHVFRVHTVQDVIPEVPNAVPETRIVRTHQWNVNADSDF